MQFLWSSDFGGCNRGLKFYMGTCTKNFLMNFFQTIIRLGNWYSAWSRSLWRAFKPYWNFYGPVILGVCHGGLKFCNDDVWFFQMVWGNERRQGVSRVLPVMFVVPSVYRYRNFFLLSILWLTDEFDIDIHAYLLYKIVPGKDVCIGMKNHFWLFYMSNSIKVKTFIELFQGISDLWVSLLS